MKTRRKGVHFKALDWKSQALTNTFGRINSQSSSRD